MAQGFNDKAVVVTGAGAGLGRETAIAFAEAGSSLFLVDINAARLNETLEAATGLGIRAAGLRLDLSSAKNCTQVIETAIGTFGRLDALCNVAGIFDISKVQDITEEGWNRTFAVNVTGPFFLCQTAIPHLIKARGAIVNVASASAFSGHPYMAPYAATKAALVSLTKSLAAALIKEPIRINAVAPGALITDMAKTPIPPDLDMQLLGLASGVRPPSPPREVADVVLFLASELAQGVHGACFNLDRGRTAP